MLQVYSTIAQELQVFAFTESLEIERPLKSRIDAACCRANRDNRFDVDVHRIAHLVLELRRIRHFFTLHNVLEVRHVEVVDQAYNRVGGRFVFSGTEHKVVELITASDAEFHETGIRVRLNLPKIFDNRRIFRKFECQGIAAIILFLRSVDKERSTLDSVFLDKVCFRRYHVKNSATVIPNAVVLAAHIGLAAVVNAVNTF